MGCVNVSGIPETWKSVREMEQSFIKKAAQEQEQRQPRTAEYIVRQRESFR